MKAIQNLNTFIEKCKNDLTVFGPTLDWGHWEWKGVVQFTKLGVKSRGVNESDILDKNFIEFAKAYFRYQQGHKPAYAKNEIKALKSLEKALLQVNGKAHILDVSITVFDEAAKLIGEHYAKGSDYHGGRELERLAKFLSLNKLVMADLFFWKNPIVRKKDEIQTGEKAQKRREKKLPRDEAINALAEIFAKNPKNNRDIFTSSTFAMLMCAPSRISEVLSLPVDCEVEELDSKGKLRYGWRFYSGKGFGGDIKWIPTEMVSVAKEAVRRIKSITDDGRSFARWMELNPGKFYRHDRCPNISEDEILNNIQICMALMRGDGDEFENIHYRLKRKGLHPPYSLKALWSFIETFRPKEFPWFNKKAGVKYSDALFCMIEGAFNTSSKSLIPVLWVPTNNFFNNDLSPREKLQFEHSSIFDRHGFLFPDGSRMKMTSHQARHLLNTLSQRGGLSNLEIAKWSGRAEIKQNRFYNHMSEYELVAQTEELDTGLSLFGPVGEVEKQVPITIQEFNILEKGPVHVTEYGVCVHDYTLSPCEKFRDCINCSEQVCIKSDDEKFKRIKIRLAEVESQYQKSLEAMEKGAAGADRWYEYHKNTLNRLKELVGIFENPAIKNGSFIKLRSDKEFTPLQRAIASRAHVLEAKEKTMLDDITELLGDGYGQASDI